MSYLVSEGLEPYFNETTIREIVEGHSYSTMYFDETVRAQVKKINWFACTPFVRSGNGEKIKYLKSIIFDLPKAQDVVTDTQGIKRN